MKTEAFTWITATGRTIPLSRLKNGHLLNIERMLRGDGAQGQGWPDDEPIGEGHLPKSMEHRIILGEVTRRELRTRPAISDKPPILSDEEIDRLIYGAD